MPRIIRWFPVTHDINADPDMWELRELYGDRAGFVWLEILSIADRNAGLVGPESDQTRNQLASKCRSSRTKVGLILAWCRNKGWLVSDNGLRVVNYLKYHGTRDVKEIPSGKLKSSPPILSEPSEPNLSFSNGKGKKSAFPSNYHISDGLRSLAREKGWAAPDQELERFRDFHLAKGNKFKDWESAFRNWLRKGKEINQGILTDSWDKYKDE